MPSKVYYVKTKDSDSVEEIAKKLDLLIKASAIMRFVKKDSFTGIKMHFGEEGNTGHIRHEWVREVVRNLKGLTKNIFLTDSNVLYKNSMRTNALDHLKIAGEHGFILRNTEAPIIIADGLHGRNFAEVGVAGKHFFKVKIASEIASCDSLLVLTHVTGHMQTGLGAAIKNLGMGCASRRGKYEQHSGVIPKVNARFCTGCGECISACQASCIMRDGKTVKIIAESCIGCGECALACRTKAIDIEWSETLENLQEKMVEYALGTMKALQGNVGFLNFIIKTTKDCDCLAKDAPKIVSDIGILASFDPVGIDKASVDLMNARSGKDILKEGYPETEWMYQLNYAAQTGLGDLQYELEEIKR